MRTVKVWAGKKQRELRKRSEKMANCSRHSKEESLEVKPEVPKSPSNYTEIESAREMVEVCANPLGAEDKDLSEAIESCQKPTMGMKGPEEGGNLCPKLGDMALLAGFDVFRFKNNFMEMVEELRLRRAQDVGNMKRIQDLLADKHELVQNLVGHDEAKGTYKSLLDEHTVELHEFTKKHVEQLQQYKNDQVKSNLLCENREKELKSLKDEMRALHLIKHNLEKKVQEQDRQLQLQNSSRENHFNKMSQLEGKCSSLFSLAEDVKEHIERLETNVKQAGELHHKLAYMNEHQKCEISQLQNKLDTCHQELVHYRAQALIKTNKLDPGTNLAAKLKTAEHELKLQVELCKHLQDELGSLRGEHQGVLCQMTAAHSLFEKHVEINNKSLEDKEELKEEIGNLRSQVEKLTASSSTTQEELKTRSEMHQKEMNDKEKKFDDTKHRLMTLQTDFKALQDSNESLEASKSDMKTEQELLVQKLMKTCEKLDNDVALMKSINKEFESKECSFEKQVESFQSALDQSEAELAKCETKLKVMEQLVFELERGKTVVSAINSQQAQLVVQKRNTEEAEFTSQLSPEVITSSDEVELKVPLGSISLKDATFSPQEDPLHKEPVQYKLKGQEMLEDATKDTLCCDRINSDLNETKPPEAKRAKLQSSSPQTSATQLESEAQLGLGCNDVSLPHQSCSGLLGSKKDGIAATASYTSSREIKETSHLQVATHTDIDQSSAVAGVNRDDEEEQHFKLTIRDSPMSAHICVRENNESMIFSPELSDEEKDFMVTTQINRQIERVEKFLKIDRLRRPKKLN